MRGIGPPEAHISERGARRRRRRQQQQQQQDASAIATTATARDNHPLYRRYPGSAEVRNGTVYFGANNDDNNNDDEVVERRAPKRECPVPKPGGVLGQLLGFDARAGEEKDAPPRVEVKIRERRAGGEGR